MFCSTLCSYAGQGSSGARVCNAMDVTLGELVVVYEWSLSSQQSGSGAKHTLFTNDNQQQDLHGRLVKQVNRFICIEIEDI